jgi:DNA ligase-1
MVEIIKPKLYSGQSLKGLWVFSKKLDGVRAILVDGKYVSRNNKPLHNLEDMSGNDLEIFLGSWEETVSTVRTINGPKIRKEYGFSLNPLDPRLFIEEINDPTAEQVEEHLEKVLASGAEGLVLRKKDLWYKVKPVETYDVPVIGFIPGKGKYLDLLGAFITPLGNVGTGLSDTQRESLKDYRGMIEVSCMSLTPSGKFRHPRFVRIRPDK